LIRDLIVLIIILSDFLYCQSLSRLAVVQANNRQITGIY